MISYRQADILPVLNKPLSVGDRVRLNAKGLAKINTGFYKEEWVDKWTERKGRIERIENRVQVSKSPIEYRTLVNVHWDDEPPRWNGWYLDELERTY